MTEPLTPEQRETALKLAGKIQENPFSISLLGVAVPSCRELSVALLDLHRENGELKELAAKLETQSNRQDKWNRKLAEAADVIHNQLEESQAREQRLQSTLDLMERSNRNLETREQRLLAAIASAPHHDNCGSLKTGCMRCGAPYNQYGNCSNLTRCQGGVGELALRVCNCWKSAALQPVEVESESGKIK